MNELNELNRLHDDHLYCWLGEQRANCRNIDPRTCDKKTLRHYRWARLACGKITQILARKSYRPRTRKPPRAVSVAAAYESAVNPSSGDLMLSRPTDLNQYGGHE